MPDICCQAVLFQVGQMSGQCFIQLTAGYMDRIIQAPYGKVMLYEIISHCAKIKLDELEI